LGFRERERFPMCSTFKALLVATVLSRVDARQEHLERRVAYSKSDLLAYAPITSAHVVSGSMTVRDLCAAAIEASDNTAANLLLGAIGGPHVVTHFARSLGDATTRLDRNEPSLNTALAGDPRDATSPLAMARTFERVALRDVLQPTSKALLQGWLVGTTTGGNRLRAGVPRTWRVGDKTGTGERGATNDIAICWPPEQRPIVITAYSVESRAPLEAREATLRAVARLVTKAFGGRG
jgi:beta-lactamase class A